LCLCLNIGTEPPDVVRTNPYAALECWVNPDSPVLDAEINPETEQPISRIEQIGKKLQDQYETLSIRIRHRLLLDPVLESFQKTCKTLRRLAKSDRVLFHYNGHGVPKATKDGEIWLFNRTYTQYVPMPMDKLMDGLGAPCIYVWDCAAAGNLVGAYRLVAETRDAQPSTAEEQPSALRLPFRSSYHFAACGAEETLPSNPNLPADLFTSCLTSPVETSLHVFALQNPLLFPFAPAQARKLPGKHSDRTTPKGYLQWVFQAVTDAIAWSVLPLPVFRKLFRRDIFLAGLFRGFLLADRIMRQYNCQPISVPEIPSAHDHPMWETWDLAIDQCLNQLPKLLEENEKKKHDKEKPAEEAPPSAEEDAGKHTDEQTEPKTEESLIPIPAPHYSAFFDEQLTAFEVWLDTSAHTREIPLQLPVVLQLLRTPPFSFHG
jgi:regulatory associated protein of mTOR